LFFGLKRGRELRKRRGSVCVVESGGGENRFALAIFYEKL